MSAFQPLPIRKTTLLILAFSMLLGCTNRQLYQAIHESQYNSCEEKPIPTQAACREQYSRNYDDYKRDRDSLLANSDDSTK